VLRDPETVSSLDISKDSQNDLIDMVSRQPELEPAAAPIGGSGSPRLLRSLIPGISIRLVRVRSYDRPGRSIVTVLLETSM
jgi:hypothetical protein